jgi:hypothetical protein
MIVRERRDGSLILIAQNDHAKLSGQCAGMPHRVLTDLKEGGLQTIIGLSERLIVTN